MQIGDLVRVHWGAADWPGTEGVDWGYALGLVTGEIVWWDLDRARDDMRFILAGMQRFYFAVSAYCITLADWRS